jgi:hypothetical protein
VNGLIARSIYGFGNPRALDIEYQAFILTVRRCLDYLAGALACFFLREVDSFRTFPKSLSRTSCPAVAAALIEAHTRHIHSLEFVLAVGRKSVRNRIAHYEFVSAGSVNLTADGFFIGNWIKPSAPTSAFMVPDPGLFAEN